ncbi:MAG: O-antigen ligase family protein [Chloroflexi bacterium]|nr:O-antigen ligase family protein [Chloroflexota bacterium]
MGPRSAPRWLSSLLALALLSAICLGLLVLYATSVRQYASAQRGQESGLAVELAPLEQPRLGTNVALERYAGDADALLRVLALLRAAGIGTLRQRFAWDELEPAPGDLRWGQWDQVLPLVQQQGFELIAVLDTSPAWARTEWEVDNPWAPPVNPADYAHFASAFARRYAGYVRAYQVWDRPNIAPHWGAGEVDPAGYVTLLRAASAALRSADPQALIIAGGLAPNTEAGGRNLSDVQYLREICRRGALEHCDVLGVAAYGFWSGAYDRRVDAEQLNYARVILLREELVRRGAADMPIWALEGGWCSLPADWSGAPSALGNDDAFVQSQRLAQALDRARQEWPWLGLLCLQTAQPAAPADDPLWGFALLDATGAPTPFYETLLQRAQTGTRLAPGLTRDWRAACLAPPAELSWWGTDIVLLLTPGHGAGELTAWVSALGEPVTIPLGGDETRVTIATRLAAGNHSLHLEGTAEQLEAVRAVQVGNRVPLRRLLALLAGGLLVLWVLYETLRAARNVPWGAAFARAAGGFARLPAALQAALVMGALVAALLCPVPLVRLALLLLYGLGALLRPDVALLIAIAAIPCAPLSVALSRWRFSVTEIAILVAATAQLLRSLLASRSSRGRLIGALHRWHLADWSVLALVTLGLASCFWAEYQHVATREWRVVVLEPALLYLLVRHAGRGRTRLLPLLDALWLGGVAVALYALAVYPSAQGVIEAEGVRRARAFYGSPNNLALYMERLLPLGIALAAWGRTRWRRWLYGLGAVPVLAALVLTFSRGAWLLGVPAALVVLAWLRGGRVRTLVLVLLVVALLALIPLARTPRFAGLLDPTRGTTFLRISLWQASWDMARDHPLLGVGLDNFLYYYRDYIRPGAEVDRYLSHPHNVALDFWLRLGAGGLLLLVALLIVCLRGLRRALRRGPVADSALSPAPDPQERAALWGLAAGLAAALAHGLIDASFFVTELACWFLVALAWITSRAGPPPPEP